MNSSEKLAAAANCDAEVVKAKPKRDSGCGSGGDGFGRSAPADQVEEIGHGRSLLPLRGTLPNGEKIPIERDDTRREWADAHGRYEAKCVGPKNYADGPRLKQYLAEHLHLCRELDPYGLAAKALGIEMEDKFEEIIDNLWTTQGKNHALDTYFAGSTFTASPFLGLISSVSFTQVSATDTAANINLGGNGWKECDGTSAPNYSIGGVTTVRGTPLWAAASAGQKAITPALAFLMSQAGTVQGCFMATIVTKSATTGVLITAGTFSTAKVVGIGDTLNVSWSAQL